MPDLWESCELCLREEGSGVGTEGNRLAFWLEGLQSDTRRDSCLSQAVEASHLCGVPRLGRGGSDLRGGWISHLVVECL